MDIPQNQKKTNYVVFIGLPNVGKSTLVNSLVGQKVAIVTHKAQTTRNALKGLLVVDDTQLVFIDTPGIFNPKKKLDKFMVNTAWQQVKEANVVCLMIDARNCKSEDQEQLFSRLKKQRVSCNLIINKIDLFKRDRLLELSSELNAAYPFENTFMISALKKDGLKALLKYFMSTAVHSPWLFDEDALTNAPMLFLISEIVREKMLIFTHEEVPHASTVKTESFAEQESLVKIEVTILVKSEGHKKIVLGNKGSMIQKIGTSARHEIEKLVGKKVYLATFVKVKKLDSNPSQSDFIKF